MIQNFEKYIFDILATKTHGSSPYHKEGSILDHINMVVSEMKNIDNHDEFDLLLAKWHDTGKIYHDITKKGNLVFRGHAVVSGNLLLLSGLLDSIEKKVSAIKIIQQHHPDQVPKTHKDFADLTTKELERLARLKEADRKGRISEKPIDPPVIPKNGLTEQPYNFVAYNRLLSYIKARYQHECVIYVPIGSSCAGKSFFAKELEKEVKLFYKGMDDLRIELYAKQFHLNSDQVDYNVAWQWVASKTKKGELLQKCIMQYRSAIKQGFSVYADNVNGAPKIRKQYVLLAKNKNSVHKHAVSNCCKVVALWFLNYDWDLLTSRNKQRGSKKFEDDVLLKVASHIVYPSTKEGFDEIIVVT